MFVLISPRRGQLQNLEKISKEMNSLLKVGTSQGSYSVNPQAQNCSFRVLHSQLLQFCSAINLHTLVIITSLMFLSQPDSGNI